MTKIYDRPEVWRTYFFPQPDRPLPVRVHAGPLERQLPDGTRIDCYWSRPLEGAPTILYLHGNRKRDQREALLRLRRFIMPVTARPWLSSQPS